MLAFKVGSLGDYVSLKGMQPEGITGIMLCLDAFYEAGLTMTLTSCRGGKHSDHSHHYKGLAWDIRVWDLVGRIDWMCRNLREKLGPEYQVINEENHIHVEFDPVGLEDS
jgi:hypothetical protein